MQRWGLLAPLPVVLPLFGAALLAGIRKWNSRVVADSLGIAFALMNVVICVLLLRSSLRETIVYWFGNWHPRGSMALGIGFVIDPIGASLALLAATLMTLALLYSWRLPDSGDLHLHPLMLVFLAGMSGFALTGDLFNMFVFFELMSTAAFALCGLNTRESAPLQGAFNFAVTNTVAAFLVLTGIALLYAVTGALNLAQIGLLLGQRHDPLVLFAFALLLCGFLTKAAIVPFHFWLADAHAVAPTAVCVLFSGVMVELGLYAVLRLRVVLFADAVTAHAETLRLGLLALGAVTAVIGGVMCYAEHHLKRILAFSTISHSGLMLMAMSLMTQAGVGGFLLYLLAHAFLKAALFFTAGILLHRLRSMSEPLLFGKGRILPWAGGLWFAGALGLAGFPLFATATAESLTSEAAEALHLPWISWLFLVAGALTCAALLRVGMHTFFGWGTKPIGDQASLVDELPEDEETHTVPWTLWLPPAICVIAAVALVWLPTTLDKVLRAACIILSKPLYIHTVFSESAASQGVFSAMAVTQHKRVITEAAALRGVCASALALMLASTSVFRLRMPRVLRVGAWMEGPLPWLRMLHSGHPGDYILYLTIGAALIGSFCMGLLS